MLLEIKKRTVFLKKVWGFACFYKKDGYIYRAIIGLFNKYYIIFLMNVIYLSALYWINKCFSKFSIVSRVLLSFRRSR